MSDRKYCCVHMEHHVNDGLVRYDDRFDQFDLVVRDGEEVQILQQIYFCPWSGDQLPPSQRDRWFDEIESKGIDPMNDAIPLEYQGSAWRNS